MKKFLSLALIAAMLLSCVVLFGSCDSADPGESNGSNETNEAGMFYLENSVNGGTVITEDSNEEFEARTAFLARGPILYSIRVIGELGSTDAIDALLQELLPHFEALPVG